jgi:hypothetical protein
MKIGATALLMTSVFLIASCSESTPPVVLNDAHSAWFGTWEHVGSEYGNNVVSDNMLLVFHPDSTVSYKRCIDRMNGHNYTTLPDAQIKSLSDKQLVVSGGFWIIRITRELPINKPPYVEGGESFLEVDGLKLRKLKAGETSTHESWKCSKDKDDNA